MVQDRGLRPLHLAHRSGARRVLAAISRRWRDLGCTRWPRRARRMV